MLRLFSRYPFVQKPPWGEFPFMQKSPWGDLFLALQMLVFHSFWQLDQISIKSAVTSNPVELRVTVRFTSNILNFWMGWESGRSHHTISYILLDMYVGIEAWVTNDGVLCGRVTGLLYLNITPFSPINTGFWPLFKPPVCMLFDRFWGVVDI